MATTSGGGSTSGSESSSSDTDSDSSSDDSKPNGLFNLSYIYNNFYY